MARNKVDYLLYQTLFYYFIHISLNRKAIDLLNKDEYQVTAEGRIYVEHCYHKKDGWEVDQLKELRDNMLKHYGDMGLRNFGNKRKCRRKRSTTDLT